MLEEEEFENYALPLNVACLIYDCAEAGKQRRFRDRTALAALTRPQRNRKAPLTACTAETAGISLESWNALEGLLREYRQPQVEVVHCRTAFLAFGDC